MLLKIMSRERGRRPPSPGEPVIVKVLPLPVTPYVNNRPVVNVGRILQHHSKATHRDSHRENQHGKLAVIFWQVFKVHITHVK